MIGEGVRRRRVEVGVSSAQLGGAVGVSQQQICRYETGEDRLTAAMLVRICGALGTSVGVLCADVETLAAGRTRALAPATGAGTAARLAQDFAAIRNPGVRGHIARLVSSLAAAEPSAANTEART